MQSWIVDVTTKIRHGTSMSNAADAEPRVRRRPPTVQTNVDVPECRLYQAHHILPPTALHSPASSIPSHLTPSRFPSFHGGHQQTIAAGAAG